MTNLNVTPSQLRQAADLKEKIEALTNELAGILKGGSLPALETAPELAGPEAEPVAVKTRQTRKKSKFSAAGLARLRAAQKARWAKVHAAKAEMEAEDKPDAESKVKAGKKGGMSAEGKARIIAAQKARWAKIKAAKAQVKTEAKPAKKRRKISVEGRARIAAGAKARWAKVKAAKAE